MKYWAFDITARILWECIADDHFVTLLLEQN